MSFNFANPRIPLGSWIETFFDWFQHAFDWLITFTNVVIGGMYDGLNLVLSGGMKPPPCGALCTARHSRRSSIEVIGA